MPKKKQAYDPTRYKIEDMWETISERPNSNWGKFLFRGRFDDNPSTVDIRNVKIGGERIVGKGISLTDEETDTVVNALVKRGYGSIEVFDEEKKRRRKLYGFDDDEGEGDALRLNIQ